MFCHIMCYRSALGNSSAAIFFAILFYCVTLMMKVESRLGLYLDLFLL